MPLSDVEAFIKKNKHLPEIPSAREIRENGLNMTTMQTQLLKKVEELTLYILAQQKDLVAQKKELNKQRAIINQLSEKF